MAAANQSKTTTVRSLPWLYVARCVVASVVTVLAVAVIVRAVVVERRRPKRPEFKLSGGRVEVFRIPSLPPPDNSVRFKFVLRAYNPRASVEYANVAVRWTDLRSASSPMIAEFGLPEPMAVPQGSTHEATVIVTLEPSEDLPVRYVRALYDGRSIEGAEMELRGVLVSEVAGETTRVLATYYCWPVSIAVDGESSPLLPYYSTVSVTTDAPCRDSRFRG